MLLRASDLNHNSVAVTGLTRPHFHLHLIEKIPKQLLTAGEGTQRCGDPDEGGIPMTSS